jgi:hypothetical protein
MTIIERPLPEDVIDLGRVVHEDRNGDVRVVDLAGFLADPFALLAELEALGDPDKIAEHLRAAGMGTSLRGIAHACPVASYLRAKTGVTPSIGIDCWSPMRIEDSEGFQLPEMPSFPLGSHVTEFVSKIDFGEYPELAVDPEELRTWRPPRSAPHAAATITT